MCVKFLSEEKSCGIAHIHHNQRVIEVMTQHLKCAFQFNFCPTGLCMLTEATKALSHAEIATIGQKVQPKQKHRGKKNLMAHLILGELSERGGNHSSRHLSQRGCNLDSWFVSFEG